MHTIRDSLGLFLFLMDGFISILQSYICRHIWRYWTAKIFVRYILPNVCLILSGFSQLSFMQYISLCAFGLPIYRMMIMKIRVFYLNIVIKSEVLPICHWLGLGHENVKYCVPIYIVMEYTGCSLRILYINQSLYITWQSCTHYINYQPLFLFYGRRSDNGQHSMSIIAESVGCVTSCYIWYIHIRILTWTASGLSCRLLSLKDKFQISFIKRVL